jgi:hypothetical protein
MDLAIYEHGKSVESRLWERHQNLNAETARCETMVEIEVRKVKTKMENEIPQYRKEIVIGEIEYQAMRGIIIK